MADEERRLTPWSQLRGHLEGFLEDEADPVVGSWAIGQGKDAPDRLLPRRLLRLLMEFSPSVSLLDVGCGSGVELGIVPPPDDASALDTAR